MREILIYDMNNWVRVKMAESMGGASLFTLWQELIANSMKKTFIFCVFDGKNSRKKRKEIYPEYKARRKPADQSIYDGMKFFKELLIYAPFNVKTIEVPEYEADDVIASISANLCEPDDKVDIVSTDRDLTQLRKLSNVGTLKEPVVEPKWVKTYKMLVGDPSDNIPGVRGFGEGAWEKLSNYTKDFLTVYFYIKYEEPDDSLLPVMESQLDGILRQELPTAKADAIEDSIRTTGEMQKWYKLVSFIPVPREVIQSNFFGGKNKIDVAQEKLGEFSMGSGMGLEENMDIKPTLGE